MDITEVLVKILNWRLGFFFSCFVMIGCIVECFTHVELWMLPLGPFFLLLYLRFMADVSKDVKVKIEEDEEKGMHARARACVCVYCVLVGYYYYYYYYIYY